MPGDVILTLSREHAKALLDRYEEIKQKMPAWKLEPDQKALLDELWRAVNG